MAKDADDKSFLGRGWSFPPTFNKATHSVEMSADEKDVEESLQILFSTSRGERVMLPDFGSDLRGVLFDQIDNSQLNLIKEMVKKAVLNYEPRIDLLSVGVDGSEYLDGIIHISLDYNIRRTNNRGNMVFPYYYEEGTILPGKYKVKHDS